MHDLGLYYSKIYACLNDGALIWKEYDNHDVCSNPNCNMPKWKTRKDGKRKTLPKMFTIFPLKPRLQHLFTSKEVAPDMPWYKEKYIDDEKN